MELTKEQLKGLTEDIVGRTMASVKEELEQYRKEDAKKYEEYKKAFSDAKPRGEELTADQKSIKAARMIRCLVANRFDRGASVDLAKKIGDETVAKALASGSGAAGGYMVPPDFAEGVIEFLRAESVVMSMGPLMPPMPNGNLTMSTMSGITASYVEENTNIAKTEPTFGQIQMSAKKLAALVPASNDLLRDTTGKADNIIRDDIIAAIAERADLAFIRDDGTQAKPKGLRHWVISANVLNETNAAGTSGGATVAEVTKDLAKMARIMMDNKIKMRKPGWLMSPQFYGYLVSARDGNGNLVWADEMKSGRLNGYPFKVTPQIPSNLTAPTTSVSEVYLVDFSHVMVGQSLDLEVSAFDGGAYYDGSGIVSGISQDQTVFRALTRHDFACRQRGKEVVVLLSSSRV